MDPPLLHQNNSREVKDFEVLEVRGVEKALRKCTKAGYDALFMPQLVDARIIAPGDSRIWNTWFTTLSLRATGRSKGNKPVIVYAHVPHYFSNPENIAKAMDSGLVNYAGKMPKEEFNRLLSLEDNRYVFVIDYDTLKNSVSGVINVEQALEHPQVAPFFGGQERAEQFLNRYREVKGEEIGIWHSDDLGDEPLGRLLFLGRRYCSALDGPLSGFGRYLGIMSEARASRKNTDPSIEISERSMIQDPSLEEVIAIISNPKLNRAGMIEEITSLYLK